jgi:hypothetical protein
MRPGRTATLNLEREFFSERLLSFWQRGLSEAKAASTFRGRWRAESGEDEVAGNEGRSDLEVRWNVHRLSFIMNIDYEISETNEP